MIRRIYHIVFFLIVISFVACGTLTRFKSGEEAYEHKHYSVAIKLLKNELSHVKNKEIASKKMFIIAESFRKMDKPKKALKWYRKSIDNNAGIQVYHNLAKVLKKTEDYNEALKVLLKAEKKFGRSTVLNKEISICKQSIKWLENKGNIDIKLLDINTEFSDFASDFYLDDYLVLSSDRFNSSKDVYAWTGNYYFDIFITDINGLTEVNPLSGDINTKFNDASACFNSDGTELFFVRCGDEKGAVRNCKIYHSYLVGGEWTQVTVMPFVKDKINYISPWLSDDNQVLYFSSDDPKGFGGYDIYFVEKGKDGWTKPGILPMPINTIGNEKFVTTWKNDLYFSSDYLAGLGGYDIFKTGYDSLGNLLPPSHLDYPLNSGGDDFYLLKSSDSTGVISSSRIDGKGLDDIYSFLIKSNKETIEIDTFDKSIEKKSIKKKIFLAVKVLENIYAEKGNPNSRVLGKKPVGEAFLNFSNDKEMFKTSNDGTIIKEITFDSAYNMIVGKKGYLTSSKSIITNAESGYKDDIVTVNVTVLLNKIYFGKEVVINNIYYDFDKWELRDKAIPTLDELYLILKNNPEFKIKIGSHTDCRGEVEYNKTLSLKRASSVVDYLISKGISQDRLEPVGYGEIKLIEKCKCEKCSEQQHQKNRRTTFEILK